MKERIQTNPGRGFWVPGSTLLSSHTRFIYDIIQIITYFLVRSLYDYKEIIYDLSMSTENHNPFFKNFGQFMLFKNFIRQGLT